MTVRVAPIEEVSRQVSGCPTVVGAHIRPVVEPSRRLRPIAPTAKDPVCVSADFCPLTLIAWRLGALPVHQLWADYLAVGGNRPQAALNDYLTDAADWSAAEHNALARPSTSACKTADTRAWRPTGICATTRTPGPRRSSRANTTLHSTRESPPSGHALARRRWRHPVGCREALCAVHARDTCENVRTL
jgi:hypothetical protein